jgi:uncharacterized GH25 family protein
MIKILKVQISKDIQLLLGTAVEILVFLNTDKPTSVTIKIEDPGGSIKISSANMTRVNSKIYNYIYQSTSSDLDGTYTVTVSVSNGGYTAVKQDNFDMLEQDYWRLNYG